MVRVGLMDGSGVSMSARLGGNYDEKVVETGTELWIGTEDATGCEVWIDTEVSTALVPDWTASPLMRLAPNPEATKAEMEAKGTVSETSEYMTKVKKI